MKRILTIVMAAAMVFAFCACGSSGGQASKTYTVGICQLVQHTALDAATKGFEDALKEQLGDRVVFDEQNASGDIATCATICNGFVASNVDLILANATPALQAATSATDKIPVLGTSITEYGVALDIADFSGTVGGNVSGTSDLAPLDQQAQMILDLFPDTKTVSILYCSSEANSVYQAKVVSEYLTGKGVNVSTFTFSDSNDVAAVTQAACGSCDVLYVPTDNTAASCAEAIGNVAEPAGVPIITGEEGVCSICGVATLTIDYYALGKTTGEMAARILKGEADVSKMPVEYYTNPVKKYNKTLAEKYGVQITSDYEVIG